MLTVVEGWPMPVAQLSGEIDAANAGEIGAGLRGLLTNRSFALIVDLTPTTYLDSAGINLLFGLGEDLERRQQELHLVIDAQSPIARMVSLTGLDVAVPTHANLGDALARAMRKRD
jgi:anti-sigma B factor antagonist